ncbi:MAG: winged helix-turn-helix transcriptional regulator, partial [Actinomycetota bacterium]
MLGNAGRRADVLRVIALDGPIPRTRIADALGVSSATVTTITRELIESGLVTMSGKRPASGRRGRPLEMLSIAPDAATVLGAKVSDDHVTAVTTDLRGSITGRWVLPFDPREDDAAGRLARLLLDTVGDVPLVGVGLGVPGTVA